MEEKKLIMRARSGDKEAFAKLYEMVYKDLYRFALVTLKNPQEAEDVVSESVICAYQSISKLKNIEAFKSWMFQIVSNQCMKVFKSRQKVSNEEVPDVGVNPDYAKRQVLWEAFERLKEKERIILSMNVFGGYNSKEIAKIMKMNPGTVRSLKSRSLETMRIMLGGDL